MFTLVVVFNDRQESLSTRHRVQIGPFFKNIRGDLNIIIEMTIASEAK